MESQTVATVGDDKGHCRDAAEVDELRLPVRRLAVVGLDPAISARSRLRASAVLSSSPDLARLSTRLSRLAAHEATSSRQICCRTPVNTAFASTASASQRCISAATSGAFFVAQSVSRWKRKVEEKRRFFSVSATALWNVRTPVGADEFTVGPLEGSEHRVVRGFGRALGRTALSALKPGKVGMNELGKARVRAKVLGCAGTCRTGPTSLNGWIRSATGALRSVVTTWLVTDLKR